MAEDIAQRPVSPRRLPCLSGPSPARSPERRSDRATARPWAAALARRQVGRITRAGPRPASEVRCSPPRCKAQHARRALELAFRYTTAQKGACSRRQRQAAHWHGGCRNASAASPRLHFQQPSGRRGGLWRLAVGGSHAAPTPTHQHFSSSEEAEWSHPASARRCRMANSNFVVPFFPASLVLSHSQHGGASRRGGEARGGASASGVDAGVARQAR